MAKFYGSVGFAVTEESREGVWIEKIIQRTYFGDVLRYNHRSQDSGTVNGDFTISQEISIVADPFAYENIHSIRYVEYMGAKWKVSSAEIQYPRIDLTIGGLYNVDDRNIETGGTESTTEGSSGE